MTEIENGHNDCYDKIIDDEIERNKKKLTDINFGIRLQKKFKKLNLFTVGDVINYPIKRLLKVNGFGRISYWRTIGTLAQEDIYHAEDFHPNHSLTAKDFTPWEENGDTINHPKHYVQGQIEPIDFINANNLDYLEGNIIKYVSRYKFKNGLEDLLKAQFYINMLIEREKDNAK